MKRNRHALAAVAFLSFTVIQACRPKDDVIRVDNARPKISGTDFVTLLPIHRIDVTPISLFGKNDLRGPMDSVDFDRNGNVYILDTYECRIFAFNNRGEFVKAFGGKGQGPGEFIHPFHFVVGEAAIYVFQSGSRMKVVDLDGNHLSSRTVSFENLLDYQHIGGRFFMVSGRTDPKFTDLTIILTRFEDEPGGSGAELFNYPFPQGFKGINASVYPWDWVFVAEDGTFYYPEDNLGRFAITKFDGDGKRRIVFGREYSRRSFSDQARKRFAGLHPDMAPGGGTGDPGFPPVVRNIFTDLKGNVWAVSGETSEDSQDPDWENTIDIFDKSGIWLNSFKSKSVSADCLYHDGRIYKLSPPDAETLKQYIDVFEIKY